MSTELSYRDNTPFAQDLLTKDFYKPESIHTKVFEVASPSQTRSTFIFPEYQRTQQSLGHVSAAQMQEALMEGLFCSSAHYCKEKMDISADDFRALMPDALFFALRAEYRKLLKTGEAASLSWEIIGVEEKRIVKKFQRVLTKVEGFIRGEVECLLPKN